MTSAGRGSDEKETEDIFGHYSRGLRERYGGGVSVLSRRASNGTEYICKYTDRLAVPVHAYLLCSAL